MAGFNLPVAAIPPDLLAKMAAAAFHPPALMGGGGGGGGGMGALPQSPGFNMGQGMADMGKAIGGLGGALLQEKPPTVQDLNQWGISEANPALAQAMRDSPNIDFRTRQANTDIAGFSTPPGGEPGWFARNFGNLFGGNRQSGGPVEPGKYYTVGEQGPETFVPAVPGRIVPRDFFGGRARR